MPRVAVVIIVLAASAIAVDVSVSYEDLKQLKSCHPRDTCVDKKPDVDPTISFENSCSCHAQCSTIGTCCADAPRRGYASSQKQKCVPAVHRPQFAKGASGFYMVADCPAISVWKHLCEDPSNKEGDVMKIAPVSSPLTNVTYRNYYCFRCHEATTGQPLLWALNVFGREDGGPAPATDHFSLTYDDLEGTWSADDDDISIPVNLQFFVPYNGMFPVLYCDHHVVSDCPESWRDDIIRRKCLSYTGLLYKIDGTTYRNAHCALCHSQNLKDLSCVPIAYGGYSHKTFSFSHLIDISRFDEEPACKKCAGGHLCDPYAKRCRKLSCALPGYVIKGGKCVAP